MAVTTIRQYSWASTDLRLLLSQLRNGEDGSYLSDSEMSCDDSCVIPRTAIESEPLKWLKYLLLDRAGVESIGKIERQIRRFRKSDYSASIRHMTTLLSDQRSAIDSRLLVAKVVPWDRGAQLKNYRLFSIEDLERAKEMISSSLQAETYHELWCCESSVAKSGFNLGGRMTWPGIDRESVVELVWYRSPRYVEMVSLPDFETPYLRATKSVGGPHYQVDVMHIPQAFATRPRNVWHEEFHQVLRLLNRRSQSMRTLVEMLEVLGAGEICFCFKVSGGEMTVIDWDTEIESTNGVAA